MAETSKNKIYYNDNEDSIADVLEDMKKLAESIDNAIEKAKYNDTELKNKNTAQDEEIEQIKSKDTTQDSLIEELQTKVVNLESENTSLKNQIPSGEATGNPIHLTDSSDLECEIVPIGGAEQETREGYNLAKTDDMIVSAGSCTLKINIPSGDYTLAFYKSRISGVTISNVYLFEFKDIKYYDSNDNLLSTLTNSRAPKLESGTVQIVSNFTAPSETSYISIEFSNNNEDNNLNTLVSKVMLLKGTYTADTLPPYEQYGASPSPDYPSEIVTVGQNGSVGISVDNGLETTDINYQSQTKTLPIQQEMLEGDYVANVEHHEYGKLIFNENSDVECIHADGTFQFTFLKYIEGTGATTKVICNMAKYWNMGAWGENGCFVRYDGYFCILCKENEFGFNADMTTDEAITHFKTILANSKLIVYYKLATPINLELTEEQKAVRENKLYTYKGITNISVDEIATLKVNYKKDLETIINNLSATSVAE